MSIDITTYPQSVNGNFFIKDTIGVPHPFCIGSGHVAHASDHFSGRLGAEAIEDYERKRQRPSCCMKNCNLSFAEHKQALVVGCKKDFKTDKDAEEELHQYLLCTIGRATEDGMAGFAFIKA